MNAHVFLSLALRVPNDRDFDRLNIGRINRVDLVLANQFVTRGKRTLGPREANAQKRLGRIGSLVAHALAPVGAPAMATCGRRALRATLAPTSTRCVASPGYTTIE